MASGKDSQGRALSFDEFLRELWPSLWFTLVDGVSIHDDVGRYLFVNPAYCRMVGYSKEELLGQSFLELVPEELRPTYLEQYRVAAESEAHGRSGQFQLRHKDGRRLHVSVRNTILRVGEARYHGFITRDITEQHSLELQLMHGDRIRALGTLAGGMAHEFNNLLVSILGYAEMIADGGTDERICAFARKIQRAARRGTQITGQLLPFSRKDEFHKEPVDLHEVLNEAIALFRLSNASGGIKVSLAADAKEIWVRANAIQLHQMFLNLFINAMDAMPDGGGLKVETSSIRPSSDSEPCIEVRVSDTGRGMDEEVRRRIFEPFFTTKRSGKGTGLGMALVFSTVASHGGTIDVESTPGEGSTVRVRFPCIEGA